MGRAFQRVRSTRSERNLGLGEFGSSLSHSAGPGQNWGPDAGGPAPSLRRSHHVGCLALPRWVPPHPVPVSNFCFHGCQRQKSAALSYNSTVRCLSLFQTETAAT